MILDPGFNLTLRPMKYPVFYEQYKAAIKNTWTVEEVDFSTDVSDLRQRMTPAEQHLINRLVAFFATGDSIVGNNLVLNLYKHINSPEARMYLSRQLFEEAQHVRVLFDAAGYVHCESGRAEAGVRCGGDGAFDSTEGGFLFQVDRFDSGDGSDYDAR